MKKIFLFLVWVISIISYAQSTITQTQTDWSGGQGQEYFTNQSSFFDHYEIDWASTAGEISATSTKKNAVGVPFEFKGRIFTSNVIGLMAFDTLTKQWNYMATNIYYIDHAILRDTLYVMSIGKIYAYDGSTNDYGLGPNGFWFHSNTPESYVFCIDAAGDNLYFGGRTPSSKGTAYKYNQTTNAWIKMGGDFTQGIYCFEEYNGILYIGTHWSGGIYAWNGTSWNSAYSTGLMTVYDFQIHDGKLYASGITTAHTNGKIVQFDGSTWTTIFSGHGVRYMTTHDNKLYFSAHKSALPGAVFAYDGTTSTQMYALENEAFPLGLLSLDGKLYYGGIEHTYGGINNSKLYKSGNTFYEIYVRYLNSSTFTATSGNWGDLSFDKSEPSNTGVKMYVMGRDNTENWGVNREFMYTPNNSAIQPTDTELRYRAVLWSVDATATASLQEVRLQSSTSVATDEIGTQALFTLYPNPCQGKIHIESTVNENYKINIYNYLGLLVYTNPDINNKKQRIDLSHLAKGIYLVEIAYNREKIIQKLNIN